MAEYQFFLAGLDLAADGRADPVSFGSECQQPGSPVRRVGGAFDESAVLEIVEYRDDPRLVRADLLGEHALAPGGAAAQCGQDRVRPHGHPVGFEDWLFEREEVTGQRREHRRQVPPVRGSHG